MTVDVLGLGAVALDLVLQCEDLPREDGFAFVREEKWLPGGSCSNVLVALTSMDVHCGIVAKIGDDSYGNAVKADLDGAGISTEHLFRKQGGTSLHTFVMVARNGSRSIFASLGDAFLSLSEADVTSEMLDGVTIFYTDMFAGRAALKLAKLCRERGIPTVFNLQCSPSFMELCGVTMGELEEMISLSHVFCIGREGLHGLTATDGEMEAAMQIFEEHGPARGVVVTLGEKGALWAGKDAIMTVPALVVDAVDTTGAGDAFVGGLTYALLLRGRKLEEALDFANACGAIKCLQRGPRLTTNEREVIRFLGAHNDDLL